MRICYKLLIVLSVALLVVLSIVAFGLLSEKNRNRSIYSSGHGSNINNTITVDQTLAKYVNVTITGQSSGWQSATLNGTVNWKGINQDPITSLNDVHLNAFTRLIKNATWSQNTYNLYNGFYIMVTPDNTTIPADAIEHKQIIIPVLSAEKPSYEFSFTLAVYS